MLLISEINIDDQFENPLFRPSGLMKCIDCLNYKPCSPGIYSCNYYAEQILNPDKELFEPCEAFI